MVAAAATVSAAMPQAKPPASPPAEATVTIAGKTITIKYSAPSVRARQVFGDGGVISKDRTYPVWRPARTPRPRCTPTPISSSRGCASRRATTRCSRPSPRNPWQLIVSKQIGEWGLAYSKDQDLGRVAIDMSTPPAPIEVFKITLTATGPTSGKMEFAWENKMASVPFTVK